MEFNQLQWLKPYNKFNTKKRMKAEESQDKDGKSFYKLINNAIYRRTIENLRNRISANLVNNEKDSLKCTSKPSYMSQKMFENN